MQAARPQSNLWPANLRCRGLLQVLLLTDRAFRDDARCSAKYGAYWQEYSKLVPYRVVPLLFLMRPSPFRSALRWRGVELAGKAIRVMRAEGRVLQQSAFMRGFVLGDLSQSLVGMQPGQEAVLHVVSPLFMAALLVAVQDFGCNDTRVSSWKALQHNDTAGCWSHIVLS